MASLSHGLIDVKVIALSVTDLARAQKFYGETLGLPVAFINDEPAGFLIGDTTFVFKENWYAAPTAEPNPRITLECEYAPDTAVFLRDKGITIADPVDDALEGYLVGSFLDSEGNKLWFCSSSK